MYLLSLIFLRGGSNWDPRTQAHWPLPYISLEIHRGLFRSPALLQRVTNRLSLASFIYSGSILVKPKVCILTFSNTGHSHRMSTDVSFSASHLLHEEVFALLVCYHLHVVKEFSNYAETPCTTVFNFFFGGGAG